MNNSPKYPRTFHLPFSEGGASDDKRLKDALPFIKADLVISEKLDGSNISLEREGCFARSHNGPPTHSSFDYLKSFHSKIKHKIPENFQIFGEYVYARHSIHYTGLSDYIYIFGFRSLEEGDEPVWGSWEEVEFWAEEIGLTTVPVLYKGKFETVFDFENKVKKLCKESSLFGGDREGVVVRIERLFKESEFERSVGKWVRKNHVQTDEHWMHQEICKNLLKK